MPQVAMSTAPWHHRLGGLGFVDVFTQLGGWPVIPSSYSSINGQAVSGGQSVPWFYLPSGYLIYINPNGTVGRAYHPSNMASIRADDPYFVSANDTAWQNAIYAQSVRDDSNVYAAYNTGVLDIQTNAEFQHQLELFGTGQAPSPIPGLTYTSPGVATYTPPAVTPTVTPTPTPPPAPTVTPTVMPTVTPFAPTFTPTVTPTTVAPTMTPTVTPTTAVSTAADAGTIFGIDSKYVMIGGAAVVLLLLLGGKR